MLLILEDLGGGLGVVEELVDFLHLLPLHALFALNSAQQAGWGQQLQGIPEETGHIVPSDLSTLGTICTVSAGCGIWGRTEGPFIPEGGLSSNLCQVSKSFLTDGDPFNLSADLDDLQSTQS